jgi:hypothetical protein
MKRQRFVQEFALLFLLALAIGFVALQSSSNLTGNIVLDGCDGNWINTTGWSSCVGGSQTMTYVNTTNTTTCVPPVIKTQSCTVENTTLCTEEWTCSDWGTCNGGSQARTCTDSNSCGTTATKPSETQSCTVCAENWTCTNWTACSSGNQTRTCTDSNSCGTENTKPSIIHSCTEETPTASITTETTPQQTCTPNMQCGDWQECINGNQIRVCTDANQCNPNELASTESQACTVPITANCSDKIKNQNETGVDCGGPCKKCSIFTIVGSAISGPINAVFANKTRVLIFSGALLLIIGGIACFKIIKKRRKK